jgi:hypothetical protein
VKLTLEARRLDEALVYFGKELSPRIQQVVALRKEMARALCPFLERNRLKRKTDRRILKELLASQLNAIVQEGGPLREPDLQQFFEQIHGVTWEQAQREEAEGIRSELEETMGDFGIDLDLSGLRPDMTNEEFAAEAARLEHELRQQWEANEDRPDDFPRSKREMKREEQMRQAEEAQKRSITSIYRQLAKALHPDLEPDPARRETKSALMQELTAAYRNNDLHTLLRLELQWIEREEGNLERMTDEKLAIYNNLLKEQVAELEMEIEHFPFQPQYKPLLTSDGIFGMRVRAADPAEARELDKVIAEMQTTLGNLRKEENAIETVQQIIDSVRAKQKFEREMRRAMQFMRF